MLIYPQTKERQPDHKTILKEVDAKISATALKLRKSLMFGSDTNINYQSLNTLYVLRDIYYSKINNADWLCNFSLDQIVHGIRKELRKSC